MNRTDMERELRDRRTGGAGARTHPLSDEDYKRELRKLERLAAAGGSGE